MGLLYAHPATQATTAMWVVPIAIIAQQASTELTTGLLVGYVLRVNIHRALQ